MRHVANKLKMTLAALVCACMLLTGVPAVAFAAAGEAATDAVGSLGDAVESLAADAGEDPAITPLADEEPDYSVTTVVFNLTSESYLQPEFNFGNRESELTVDWGDGTTSTVPSGTGSTSSTKSDAYETTGTYTVTISSEGTYWLGGGSSRSDAFIASDYRSSATSIVVASNAVPQSYSFYGCSQMATLDLSACDTSSVTDMSYMFYGCLGLAELDVSGFDTSKVTSMSSMFNSCSGLTELDVSGFDTSKVTDMSSMFYTCRALTSLDVSGFDTSRVTNMSYMFSACSLDTVDLSGFDTSSVTGTNNMSGGMSYMFYQSQFTSLDLSSFDTSNVTTMYWMFRDCSSLTSLDVSGFNTSNVTDMEYMFYNCSELAVLDVSGFDISNVTDMYEMLYGCSSLTSLDLSGFDTSSATDMRNMFDNCSKLRKVTLGDAFSFSGAGDERQCELPVSYALPYEVTGAWVDIATGTAYDCDEVPNNTAATYYAQSAEPLTFDEGDFEVSPLTLSYTGKALMPDVVSDLFEGTEYTLSATDNVNPGTATLTIDGAGNYTSSKLTYNFKITGKAGGTTKASKNKKQTIKLAKKKVTVKRDGKKAKVKVKGAKTKLVAKPKGKAKKALKVKVKGKKKLIVRAKPNAKRGTYKVQVYAKQAGCYSKSKTVKLKVKVQ